MYQDKIEFIDELDTLKICHDTLIELISEVPDGACSTKNLAVLIGYLNDKQNQLVQQLLTY